MLAYFVIFGAKRSQATLSDNPASASKGFSQQGLSIRVAKANLFMIYSKILQYKTNKNTINSYQFFLILSSKVTNSACRYQTIVNRSTI